MHKLLRIIILCFTALLLASCCKEQVVSPREYCDLLLKAKDFLAFCCFVLDSPKPYYGQIISRLYYVYFTLARLIVLNKTEYDYYGHEMVWKKIEDKKIEYVYGKELKKKRCKYDYDSIKIDNIKEQLNDIIFIVDNKCLFDNQIKMIKNTLHDNPNLTEESDEKCIMLLEDMGVIHQTLISKLTDCIRFYAKK